ncbi:MAG: hypothetical protein II987_06725 [Clostridia bacterium]|nr:hypothetical protein [Clostridia bacterium]
MLITIYKNTLKTIFRTKTFWLCMFVMLIVAAQGAISGYYVGDDEPGTVLNFNDYIQVISNCCITTLLQYAMPIFSIITVALIINHDYRDNFFEIEKSAGMKPSHYVLGRISALLALNSVIVVLLHFICLYTYLITRGWVKDMTYIECIADSLPRILRIDAFVAIPCITFYLGIALLFGNVLKSGIATTVFSSSYAIAYYVFNLIFRHRIGETYFNYFSPIPKKLRQYFHFYDTEWFDGLLKSYDLSIEKAIFCLFFLVGIFILGALVSYLITRKRTV